MVKLVLFLGDQLIQRIFSAKLLCDLFQLLLRLLQRCRCLLLFLAAQALYFFYGIGAKRFSPMGPQGFPAGIHLPDAGAGLAAGRQRGLFRFFCLGLAVFQFLLGGGIFRLLRRVRVFQ